MSFAASKNGYLCTKVIGVIFQYNFKVLFFNNLILNTYCLAFKYTVAGRHDYVFDVIFREEVCLPT